MKDHYSKGTGSFPFLCTNDEVVDYFSKLNEKDIEFVGMLGINTVEIE